MRKRWETIINHCSLLQQWFSHITAANAIISHLFIMSPEIASWSYYHCIIFTLIYINLVARLPQQCRDPWAQQRRWSFVVYSERSQCDNFRFQWRRWRDRVEAIIEKAVQVIKVLMALFYRRILVVKVSQLWSLTRILTRSEYQCQNGNHQNGNHQNYCC